MNRKISDQYNMLLTKGWKISRHEKPEKEAVPKG